MASSTLNRADLIAYDSAAAGHEGILSDPTGALVIKPCHTAEIAFYEDSFASHPDFAAFLPTYIGKLSLSSPEQQEALYNQDPTSIGAALQSDLGDVDAQPTSNQKETLSSADGNDHGPDGSASTPATTTNGLRKFGKKLESEMAIVLENVTAGFVHPCILDVKLGKRLWDDGAPSAKRARLDQVASETTSSSLGFRLAGMRIWQGEGVSKLPELEPAASATAATAEPKEAQDGSEGTVAEIKDGYAIYNKLYGRRATDVTVIDGFKKFFTQSPAGKHPEYADMLLRCCEDDLARIQEVMEAQESRMYSASILFVYEGDRTAMDKAVETSLAPKRKEADNGSATPHETDDNNDDNDDNDDDDDDGDATAGPKVYAIKLIDFAHAAWTPGEGPDENALRGIRNVRKILAGLSDTV